MERLGRKGREEGKGGREMGMAYGRMREKGGEERRIRGRMRKGRGGRAGEDNQCRRADQPKFHGRGGGS